MRIKLTGTSFRNNAFELPIGTELELRPDPNGEVTGQEHSDPNAISVWVNRPKCCLNSNCEDGHYPLGMNDDGEVEWGACPDCKPVGGIYSFLGYIPKDLTHNTFKKVAVSNVWYKSPKNSVQGVTTIYTEGDLIAGIEVECEGDFQITTDEGRTYQTEGKEYESITSFLGRAMPSNLDPLMQWAFKNYNSYDEYKEGLNGYADAGTELHNKIEEYLLMYQDKENKFWENDFEKLPENVQRFFKSLGDFKVISVEDRYYDDELGLACTSDAILEVKGKKIAFDWKSSKAVQNKHKVQVCLPGKINKCDLGAIVCFGAQNKQGYSVSKVNIENGYKYLTHLVEADKISKNLTYKK